LNYTKRQTLSKSTAENYSKLLVVFNFTRSVLKHYKTLLKLAAEDIPSSPVLMSLSICTTHSFHLCLSVCQCLSVPLSFCVCLSAAFLFISVCLFVCSSLSPSSSVCLSVSSLSVRLFYWLCLLVCSLSLSVHLCPFPCLFIVVMFMCFLKISSVMFILDNNPFLTQMFTF